LGGDGRAAWWSREFLGVVSASLLLFGARHAAQNRRARVAAALLFAALISIRYWTIKQWHEVLCRRL